MYIFEHSLYMIIHISTSSCKYSSVQLIVYAYSIIPKISLTIIDIFYSTSCIFYILYIELCFNECSLRCKYIDLHYFIIGNSFILLYDFTLFN